MHVTEAQTRRIVRRAYQPGHALVHIRMRRGGGRSGLTLPRYGHAVTHSSMHRGGGRSDLTLPRYESPRYCLLHLLRSHFGPS